MTSIYKKTVLDIDTYCAKILDQLATEQDRDSSSNSFGNYPSSRYHRILPLRRKEDNVYFVSWINQLLDNAVSSKLLSQDLESQAMQLIEKGDKAISAFRNRYGGPTYNFYRPKDWFPNGRLLSRFGVFQPTDDSDDTSIAFRGRTHTQEEASDVKDIFKYQSNGKRNRWLKRMPKEYRQISCYSTWIGSDQIYVDTDIVVLSNILMFNAKYKLNIGDEDRASLLFIRKAVLTGDYLKRKWSMSAWYPFNSVILYSLADLVTEDYYDELNEIKENIIADLSTIDLDINDAMDRMLVDTALMKLGLTPRFMDEPEALESVVNAPSTFSFGVIPLLHPWNGKLTQYLSSSSIFRLYYDCKAQRLAILLENLLLRKHRNGRDTFKEKRRARSYKPDSVNPNTRVPYHLSTRPTL